MKAKQLAINFIEMSAKTGYNVEKGFQDLAMQMMINKEVLPSDGNDRIKIYKIDENRQYKDCKSWAMMYITYILSCLLVFNLIDFIDSYLCNLDFDNI